MEIDGYHWGNESTNTVGICIREGSNKIMVWCDEDDYELDGACDCEYQHFGGGDFAGEPTGDSAVAHALGEVLLQMIGGYA